MATLPPSAEEPASTHAAATAEIWIDFRPAVVRTFTAQGRSLAELRNSAEGRLHPFLSEVIAAIGEAMTVLVFGPGEAKTELGKRLRPMPVRARIHAMGPAGSDTPRRIAERSRDQPFA